LFFSLGVPCILPVYFGLRPFAPFLIYFTYQKKKGTPILREYKKDIVFLLTLPNHEICIWMQTNPSEK